MKRSRRNPTFQWISNITYLLYIKRKEDEKSFCITSFFFSVNITKDSKQCHIDEYTCICES